MEIALTKHQAAALKNDVAEIRAMQIQFEMSLQLRRIACQRHADTIIRDAGQDPTGVWELAERDGKDVLVLLPPPPTVGGLMTAQQMAEEKMKHASLVRKVDGSPTGRQDGRLENINGHATSDPRQ